MKELLIRIDLPRVEIYEPDWYQYDPGCGKISEEILVMQLDETLRDFSCRVQLAITARVKDSLEGEIK